MMYEMWYKYIQILISYEITINLDYVIAVHFWVEI